MSYGSSSLENDIRARAAVLASAMVATAPQSDSYRAMRDEFKADLDNVRLPPDEMTWFAVGRVAARAGVAAVRLTQNDTPIPAGALVLISPNLEAPENAQADVVRALRSAGFVIAPASWGPVLNGAGLNGLGVDPGDEAVAAPEARTRKPGR